VLVTGANDPSRDRRHRVAHTLFEGGHRIAQITDGCAAVERPVVAEDLDRAPRNERRPAEHRHPQFFERRERGGGGKRDPHRPAPAGDVPNELEDACLGRVLATELIAGARCAAFERGTMSGGHIVDVRVRPGILRAHESGQPASQVIRDEPADEIAFGEGAGTVNDAGIHPNKRMPVADRFVGDAIRGDLGPLVVVRFDRGLQIPRRQGQKRRGVHDLTHSMRGRGREDVPQAADVDIVEVQPPPAPDADERGRM
jgi:hypothetical protein